MRRVLQNISTGLLICSFSLTAHSRLVHYSFISNWEIKASVKDVWDIIDDGANWGSWWSSVVKAKTISDGSTDGIGRTIHYEWKSYLPLKLKIDYRVTSKELYKRISGVSSGDLVGTGVWTFEERGGITYVQYQWEVESNKTIFDIFSPLFPNFFISGHDHIMKRGAKGLAKKLHAELVRY